MPCNCGKANGPKEFIYTAPDGRVTVYQSEIQAQVAKVKNKGGSYVARLK